MTPFEAHILIQQGSPSNHSLSSGETTASTNSLKEALKSHRLNPNGTFKRESFLCTAIKGNSPNLLRLLLEYGACADLKSYENGRYEPAIITAVRCKSLTCVQILLEYGADVYRTNFYGSDAIFQAVWENASSILEYLLVECHPAPGNENDRRRKRVQQHKSQKQSEVPSSSPPPPRNPIVIQRVTATKQPGEACPGTVLNIKESSHYKRGDYYDYHDHVLCPFYYALNNSVKYPSKEKSLVQLLQHNYKCKCVRELASCSSTDYTNGDKLDIMNCLVAVDSFLEKNSETVRPAAAFSSFSASPSPAHAASIDREGKERSGHDHYNRLNAIFPSVDVDYENYMKLGHHPGRKFWVYKILRIEEKCHAIKENECSSSSPASYLVLVGPLKLSCIAREVIRNQIRINCVVHTKPRRFCNSSSCNCAVALSPSPQPPLAVSAQGNYTGEQIQEHTNFGKRNFRKCLETLLLPKPLTDYVLYGNLRMEGRANNVKLIKKDLMLNVNHFAFHIS